jgi:hypothetical protein
MVDWQADRWEDSITSTVVAPARAGSSHRRNKKNSSLIIITDIEDQTIVTAETIVIITEVNQNPHPDIGDPVPQTIKETTKGPAPVTDLITTNKDETN